MLHSEKRQCRKSFLRYSFESLQVTLYFLKTWTRHLHYSVFHLIQSQWDHHLPLLWTC